MTDGYRLQVPAIAKYTLVAFDCPDPSALAAFYSAITGWPIERDDGDWVQLRSEGGATLAFQLAENHVPPVWPTAEHSQQAHLDFDVDDLAAGEEQVLAIGATRAAVQPGTGFTVFLDPAGHPFCLVLAD
jgi:catechol 2,3-dioxygenase-like lactoylglutathione lyase family enzyme